MKIDREYVCTWADEMKFLSSKGIKYTFVKEVDGVTVWKYKKNGQLFFELSKFYNNVYSSGKER